MIAPTRSTDALTLAELQRVMGDVAALTPWLAYRRRVEWHVSDVVEGGIAWPSFLHEGHWIVVWSPALDRFRQAQQIAEREFAAFMAWRAETRTAEP
jgi:hypothetical protein